MSSGHLCRFDGRWQFVSKVNGKTNLPEDGAFLGSRVGSETTRETAARTCFEKGGIKPEDVLRVYKTLETGRKHSYTLHICEVKKKPVAKDEYTKIVEYDDFFVPYELGTLHPSLRYMKGLCMTMSAIQREFPSHVPVDPRFIGFEYNY